MNTRVHPPSAFGNLDLTGIAPLAAGSERRIYQHPLDPSLLIKVISFQKNGNGGSASPRKRDTPPGAAGNEPAKSFHREDIYTVFKSELVEYVAVQAQAQGAADYPIPLARIAGFAQTSMGLGLVVEKIADEQGNMGPTLRQLVARSGFDDSLEKQLRDFFGRLADNHVIFNDVGASNIVCGYNASGRRGMYLVDGFGPRQLVPLYAWSKALNRRRLMRKYPEIVAELRRVARSSESSLVQ